MVFCVVSDEDKIDSTAHSQRPNVESFRRLNLDHMGILFPG